MSKSSSIWIAIGLAVILAVVAIVQVNTGGGATAVAAGESKLSEVLDRGHVIVGVTSEVPPFGYVDDETQELSGFDIDLARLIAKSLFEDENAIEFQRVAFPARWDAVNNNDVDFGIMVTTIWPDRVARVNFTRGYVRSGIAVLARSDLGVDTWEEMNSSDYTFAILATPSEEKIMQELLPEAETLVLGSEADMLTAVRTNRAQALLIDTPVAAWRADNLPELVNLGLLSGQTQNAIFLRQNDFQWWLYLDTIVGEMRCGSLYEEYAEIYEEWFAVSPEPPESCLTFSLEEFRGVFGG